MNRLKIIVKALIIILILGASFYADAQVDDIEVRLISNQVDSIKVEGEVVRLPVILDTIYTDDVAGENIIAMNLNFSHSAVLKPINFVTADGLIDSWSVNTNVNEAGNTFRFTAAGTTPIALDSGLLFYVDFEIAEVTGNTTATFSLTGSDNELNEGGYDLSMQAGRVQVRNIAILSTSLSPQRLTVGDSTRIFVSGGEAPYTYSLEDPSFGRIVSDNYFLAEDYGIVQVNVEDANGLMGQAEADVRAFRLSTLSPADAVFPGDAFEGYITTTDLAGLDVISGTLRFSVSNSSTISFSEFVTDGTLLEGASVEVSQFDASNWDVAFATTVGLTAGDTLLGVRFNSTSESAGTATFSLTVDPEFNEEFVGNRGTNSTIRFIDVTAPTISNPFANYIPGDEVQFTGTGGTPPYTWAVSDTEVASIDTEGLLTVLTGGTIDVIITDDLGISASKELSFFDGRVTVLAQGSPPGSTFNLPIQITEFPAGRGISALEMEVTYDPAQVSFLDVEKVGSLTADFTYVVNPLDENTVKIVAASSSTINGPGDLLYLSFELDNLAEGQTSSVRIDRIALNEGSPVATIVNGSIRAVEVPSTADFTIEAEEDRAFTFDPSDIPFDHPDDTESLGGIRFSMLPASGTLSFNGGQVFTNTTYLTSQITQLTFQNDLNENGNDYTQIPFFVVDQAGALSNTPGLITVNVAAVNDPPSFAVSEQFLNAEEDFAGSLSTVLTADEVPTDEQGETVTYSIDPATVDFADVDFDTETLTVTFTAVQDSSGIQVFEISADDGQDDNNVFTRSVTLTVTAVDDAPSLSDQEFTVNENLAVGTVIGVLDAEDIDSDLAFTITDGNTDDAFSINDETAELFVNNTAALDFETNPVFTLTVTLPHGTEPASATITVNLNDIDEDVNQAPQILDQSFAVDENSANGTVVGTVDAFDPDGDALTFSITAGNTSSAFSIDEATGELTVSDETVLDFETIPTFTLTVEVNDGALTDDAVITIDLNDVSDTNVAPEIVDQAFTVAENSANGTVVGTVVATDSNGDALSFSISAGNTNDAFEINEAGELTVGNVSELDFETTPSFSLTVEVTDGSLSASATITVDLIDVDESVNQAPQILDQGFAVDENSANGTVVGTVDAFDPDGDALTFSITAGNTSSAFAIDAASGELSVSDETVLDFETTPTFTLTVEVSDGALMDDATVTIDLDDVNDTNVAPEILDQAFTVAENSANGTVVGTVVATDSNGDALSFSISAGNTNDAFEINEAGELTVGNVSALDFETTPSFSLTVEVTDGLLSASATITVDLTDVDESVNQAPQILDQNFAVDENSANGTAVGTVDAFDPDGDALTFSITAGNTSNAFAIDGATGDLTVSDETVLDFETTPTFTLTVEVSDGALTDDATVTIDLDDVNDTNVAPEIVDQAFTVAENSANGTVVGTVIATDSNGDALTFSISAGNTNGAFDINAAGELTVGNVSELDFEVTSSFSLTVEVSDGSLSASATITVDLTDVDESVNQAPQILDQNFVVDENSANGTAVGTVDAFDPDGDALTFSITAGNTSNAFAIDGTTGELTVSDETILDFETTPTFTLTVEVSDGALTDDATVTIDLNDLVDSNVAPEIVDQTFALDENSPANTFVGIVAATDANGDALTYSITGGNDLGGFSIESASGELLVADESVLDFETTPSFVLTVEVSDGSLTASALVTINLNDLNDENAVPEISDQTFSIDENSAIDTSVGVVTASDPDGDALAYSITGGNDLGGFSIESASGELLVADESVLDFETTPSFVLTVEVSDGSLTASALVTINLNDLNDENAVPEISDQTFSIDENSAIDTSVGVVTASDPDGDALAYSITGGNDLGGFSIDGATGELSVADASVLDFETTPSFGLTVEVSDGSLTASALITINLNDVFENNAPTIVDQVFAIDENSAVDTSVGSVDANDPDGDALFFTILAGNDLGGFTIENTTGELLVADAAALDFESNPSFGLIVEVSDGDLSASALVTVNLNDVFENNAPTVSDQTFSIDENSEVNVSVGVVSANDPDGDALFFSITEGNDQGGFSIDTNSGELLVADAAVLDFETTPSFSLTVEVSDGDLSAFATITIDLNDVDENTLSIDTQVQDQLVVFPNPVVETLRIQFEERDYQMAIYDLSGVLVKEYFRAQDEYDVSDLSEGTYTVIIQSKDQRNVQRFIKK